MSCMFSRKIILAMFILVALPVLVSAERANATLYYVATTGSDSNPGTSSQPLRTITKGVLKLSAGDTLYVASGTYTDSIDTWKVPFGNGISWSTPITVAAQPGHTVTIKPSNGNPFFWIAQSQNKYLIIKGFIIDGQNTNTHGFKLEGFAKYVRVIDCEIKNFRASGILVTGNTESFHEFINLNIHHNGASNLDHGIYLTSGNNLVERSEVHHNKGYGIHLYNGNTTAANNNIIRNNRVHDNTTTGQWGCGILLSSGNGNQAYNNVVFGNFAGLCSQNRVSNSRIFNNHTYENKVYGIYVGYSSTSGTRVENNTVYKNGTYGIFSGDGATTTTAKNNIAYSNTINFGLTNTSSSNNLDTDPLFVNAVAKDFHLQSNSPAIDKGTTISGLSTDFDGKPRPKGSQFDIGAHEYQGTSTTSSTSTTSTSSTSTSSTSTSSTSTSSFPPPLISPAPGSTLTSSTVTFTGAHNTKYPEQEHMLRVGTTNGGSQIYYQSMGTNHSVTVSGLPTSGTIYVMYWTRISTGWFQQTHTYTMKR